MYRSNCSCISCISCRNDAEIVKIILTFFKRQVPVSTPNNAVISYQNT